jgi:squalene-hopene/tetraprenyl-beta-curcumene cyclase
LPRGIIGRWFQRGKLGYIRLLMTLALDRDRLLRCYQTVRAALLAEQTPQGHWVGELSTSALSTATAVMALEQVRRATQSPAVASAGSLDSLISRGVAWLCQHQNADGGWGDTVKSFSNISTTMLCRATLVACGGGGSDLQSRDRKGAIRQRSEVGGQSRDREGVSIPEADLAPTLPHGRGSEALAPTLPDGRGSEGLSHLRSEISDLRSFIDRATQYIDRAGGIPALIARYGKDKTFSVPILTHCALAGLVEWRTIPALPFELACIPARFYKTVRLPVVSYALPALIAIGQVRHHFAPTWNPVTRVLRNLSVERSLRVLERIQPPHGGFLEATPLTSFVTMSLAAKGLADHPVVRKGVEFIVESVRPDGSWPIDTNLATWVTTLAVNALGGDLPEESREPILKWLIDQQYKEVHPYTNADPGGWAWTDLPGGVPDADDTPGAILALLQLCRQSRDRQGAFGDGAHQPQTLPDGRGSEGSDPVVGSIPRSQAPARERTRPEAPLRDAHADIEAVTNGVAWLLELQNRDGGFPTFCRGWGALPFDRSSADITAHCIRAIARQAGKYLWNEDEYEEGEIPIEIDNSLYVYHRAMTFLKGAQNPDGSWHPLWFGNQHASDDANPTYGTAKVLMAYRDCGLLNDPAAQRGLAWLSANQNADGGWGGCLGTPSSVEETSLATEASLPDPASREHVDRGLTWLMDRVDAGTIADPAPIGFYFAKLWYFERLYPLICAVSCLRRAIEGRGSRVEG